MSPSDATPAPGTLPAKTGLPSDQPPGEETVQVNDHASIGKEPPDEMHSVGDSQHTPG